MVKLPARHFIPRYTVLLDLFIVIDGLFTLTMLTGSRYVSPSANAPVFNPIRAGALAVVLPGDIIE